MSTPKGKLSFLKKFLSKKKKEEAPPGATYDNTLSIPITGKQHITGYTIEHYIVGGGGAGTWGAIIMPNTPKKPKETFSLPKIPKYKALHPQKSPSPKVKESTHKTRIIDLPF